LHSGNSYGDDDGGGGGGGVVVVVMMIMTTRLTVIRVVMAAVCREALKDADMRGFVNFK
jgi:hypothetical protein